ncbi:MAG: hypothetical protein JWL64_1078, partial [Frankiales bacterium]|nr:hypothetical protein [Frankiales bacterium]
MRVRRLAALVTASALTALVGITLGPTVAQAATSPLGDAAAAWPASFSAYRYASGALVQDANADINPSTSDLTSGPCTGASCTGGLSTSDFTSDGTNVFFRTRVATDIRDASKGGLVGNAFLVDIAVGGVIKAAVGVDGKSASLDYVYATDPTNSAALTYEVYDYPFTTTSAGLRVIPDGSGAYFLDYQIPVKYITMASQGAITASTPVQLFYGSSAAANLAIINKDFFNGTGTTVDFTGLSTVSFGAPAATLASGPATYASGPNPPRSGVSTTYTAVLTARNTAGVDLNGTAVTATLPGNVTLVSPPAGVALTGSTLSWAIGTLYGGATATTSVQLAVVPSQAQVGTTAALLGGQTLSGTDANFGTTVTATAPALSTPVNVLQGNRPPVAVNDAVTTNEDLATSVDVTTNDSDPDGDAMTGGLVVAPTKGTATFTSAGTVAYTPAANRNGTDTFTYRSCDPAGLCSAPATVT